MTIYTEETLIILPENYEGDQEELRRKHGNAKILNERDLENLSEGQKKRWSNIVIFGGGKKDSEKIAELLSKVIDKSKKIEVKIIFENSSKLTENQKKEYVKKLEKSLQDRGINISSITHENTKSKKEDRSIPSQKSNQLKENIQKRREELEKLSKEKKLQNQVSQTFGRIERSKKGSYTI